MQHQKKIPTATEDLLSAVQTVLGVNFNGEEDDEFHAMRRIVPVVFGLMVGLIAYLVIAVPRLFHPIHESASPIETYLPDIVGASFFIAITTLPHLLVDGYHRLRHRRFPIGLSTGGQLFTLAFYFYYAISQGSGGSIYVMATEIEWCLIGVALFSIFRI